jgi:hypothetical protein
MGSCTAYMPCKKNFTVKHNGCFTVSYVHNVIMLRVFQLWHLEQTIPNACILSASEI